jgi:hypothetical protein
MNALSSRLDELSPGKRALVEQRLLAARAAKAAKGGITRRDPSEAAPLSFAQQRLWFLDRLQPGTHTYNAGLAWRLRGALDRDALERAVRTVVERHEVLRTVYVEEDGLPAQRVLPLAAEGADAGAGWRVDERWAGSAPDDAVIERALRDLLHEPFRLAEDLMFRAVLLPIAEEDHVFAVITHHIACDGWSKGALFEELAQAYGALAKGVEPELAELPIQYADYATWQRRTLQGETLAGHVEHWRALLDGVPPALDLPTDHPRPPVQSFAGAFHWFDVPAPAAEALRELGRQERATPFMAELAVFGLLLCAASGQDAVAIGSPIAGRSRVETEQLIGFFVNTLVMVVRVDGDPTGRELLRRVREMALGAYGHQDLPFEKLVEALRPPRDPSRNPIFQVNFRLQSTVPPVLELAGLAAEPLEVDPETSRFDLAVELTARPDGSLRGYLEHNVALFDPSTAARLVHDLAALSDELVAAPDVPVSTLPTMRAIRGRATR